MQCSANHDSILKFAVTNPPKSGAKLALMSSHTGWDPAKALQLLASEGGLWTTELDVPSGSKVEYKLVLQSEAGEVTDWQPGDNHVLEVPEHPAILRVRDSWDGQPDVEIEQRALDRPMFERSSPVQQENVEEV